MNLLTLLSNANSQCPAIIQDDKAFSYAEVLASVDRLKRSLHSHRRVLVVSNEALTIFCALAACESLAIPLWIGHPFAGSAVLDALSGSQQIDVRVENGFGVRRLDGLAPKDRSDGFAVHVMTSGTVGVPKISYHTLSTLTGRIRFGDRPGSMWLLTYPPSAFAGLQVLLTAVATGSSLAAFQSGDVRRLATALAEYAVTHVSATATFWRAALMVLPVVDHLSSLRQITVGGEIADQALLDRLAGTFPHARIVHIYASTEAGALFSVKDGRAGFPADWLSNKVDGVELRVRNGILEVRSPRGMRSYASPHANPYTEDGWLQTGDLVDVCGDRVFFRGRNDQTINIAGTKVLPQEVEAVILGFEGVADARVTGVRNPVSGFVLKAEVVAAPGCDHESLRKVVAVRCRSSLPAYKVPRVIVVVPQLNISASGKKSAGAA